MISAVPAQETDWGTPDSTFLVWRGKVVTVVFVARVLSTFHRALDGGPSNSQSVKFKFLSPLDLASAIRLVYDKAQPRRGKSFICASGASSFMLCRNHAQDFLGWR